MRLPSFTKHASKGTASKDGVATGHATSPTDSDNRAATTKPSTKSANESSGPFTITCNRCSAVLPVYITTKRIEAITRAGNQELNKHQRRCEGPRRSQSESVHPATAPISSKDAPVAGLWNKPRASSENTAATFDANGAFLKRATNDSRSSSSMPPTTVSSNKVRASESNKTTTDHAGARAAKRLPPADRSRTSSSTKTTSSSGPSRSTGPSHSVGRSSFAGSDHPNRPPGPARAPSYSDFYQREIEAKKREREEEEAKAVAALAVHRGRKRGVEVPIEKDAGAMDEVMASIYNGKAKAEDEAERNVKKQRTA
ncbi:hypothetical protein K523DRAFT_249284 [Schizophyllum commune Tattone D]|nr:hypothetical protein K523DRAFT_249284 [Schizophyllum commune Tattone D]